MKLIFRTNGGAIHTIDNVVSFQFEGKDEDVIDNSKAPNFITKRLDVINKDELND